MHARQHPVAAAADDVRIGDALQSYLTKVMRGRPSEEAAQTACRFFTQYFERNGILQISQLTLDVQDAYIDWRRTHRTNKGTPPTNGTIGREMSVLRAAVREHWKRGYLTAPPFIRTLPKGAPRQRFLTEAECHQLLDACELPHLRLFVLLALHTLQRPGAVLRLRCSQVDLDANRIDFLPSGERQTNKRRPVVPISATLRPALEAAVANSQSGFVVEYRGGPVGDLGKSLISACKQAGIEPIIPYTLRHTGATLLAAKGVPLRQIAGMLGHSQARTTELYAKHSPDFMGDAVAALDGMFG